MEASEGRDLVQQVIRNVEAVTEAPVTGDGVEPLLQESEGGTARVSVRGERKTQEQTHRLSGSISVQRKAIRQKTSGQEPQYFSRKAILLSPKSGLRGM